MFGGFRWPAMNNAEERGAGEGKKREARGGLGQFRCECNCCRMEASWIR